MGEGTRYLVRVRVRGRGRGRIRVRVRVRVQVRGRGRGHAVPVEAAVGGAQDAAVAADDQPHAVHHDARLEWVALHIVLVDVLVRGRGRGRGWGRGSLVTGVWNEG